MSDFPINPTTSEIAPEIGAPHPSQGDTLDTPEHQQYIDTLGEMAAESACNGDLDTCRKLLRAAAFITELQQRFDDESAQRTEWEKTANTDPVTGLANRRGFMNSLEQHIGKAARSGKGAGAIGVLFGDLNGFKAYNDRLGHAVGDKALQVIGGKIETTTRSTDITSRWSRTPIGKRPTSHPLVPARLGGDEFAIFLPDLYGWREPGGKGFTPAERLMIGAKRVAQEVESAPAEMNGDLPINVSIADFPITISIGGVLWAPGETADELVARADAMMYRAKEYSRAHGGLSSVYVQGLNGAVHRLREEALYDPSL